MIFSPVLWLVLGLATAVVLPRDEWSDKVDEWASKRKPPQELIDAFKNKPEGEEPTLEDYKQPNEYLKVVFSPGDSYTAGVGSDGPGDLYHDSKAFSEKGCGRYRQAWPERLRDHSGWKDLQGDGWRKNNFGACSGGTISDITDKQLELGENKDEDQFKKIGDGEGAPQIAVLTAGGNDFEFGEIVQKCILGVPYGTWGCNSFLKKIEERIADKEKWKSEYKKLWSKIITVGRMAKGADPPESFQVYHGTYIPFFNQYDEECNWFSWTLYNGVATLNTDLRTRLNKMVESVNEIIREASDEMQDWGVYYVDKYQRDFDGHRFCDPTDPYYKKGYQDRYHDHDFQDSGSQTWFWSWESPWKDGDEGPDHPIWNPDDLERRTLKQRSLVRRDKEQMEKAQKILDHLVPDKGDQEKIKQGEDPTQFNAAFKDEDSFMEATKDLDIKGDEHGAGLTDDSWFRIFHPKGKGLERMAEGFFQTIKMWRKWDFHSHEPKKALNIVLEQADKGIEPDFSRFMKWLFYSVDKGTSSMCMENPMPAAQADVDLKGLDDPPFPSGTFPVKTQDGDCEYKNDGTGGPGALWCSGTAHSCWAHPNKDKKNREGEQYCVGLSGGTVGKNEVSHRPIAICEW